MTELLCAHRWVYLASVATKSEEDVQAVEVYRCDWCRTTWRKGEAEEPRVVLMRMAGE